MFSCEFFEISKNTFLHRIPVVAASVYGKHQIVINIHDTQLITEKKAQERKYVMICANWYYLYNFKNVKNTHGGVLLLVKLQSKNLQLY